jgi:hypothetical protein
MGKKEITNIAVISGNAAKVRDGHIIYEPSQSIPLVNNNFFDNRQPLNIVHLRSDATFGSGELEFVLKCQNPETSVELKLDSIDGRIIFCGYSYIYKSFTISEVGSNGWKPLIMAGKLEDYDLAAEIKFRITIKGSQITLFINNILLCSANISVKDSPIEFVAGSTDKLEIYNIIKHDSGSKPSAFVVMQFSREYNELFDEVIKPVTEGFGYECIRADETYTSTPILNDIIQSIKDSSVVVAEITPDNPNVFYEIGYSHAIGKPTILLCDKTRGSLPFDISGFRTLFYENTIAGKKKVENNLKKYLERI